MATVYWITGLSGAGKTTIGTLFYKKLKELHPNTVFLDGDMLREVFGGNFGYQKEDRKKCAMCYSRLCAMLAKQDINVVCCTISMFHSVRAWNRNHIKHYKEIYIKTSWKTLQKRNQKDLYSGAKTGSAESVVGIHIDYEEPQQPDLVLQNDGEFSPEEQAQRILSILS